MAHAVFAERVPLAERYVALLASDGIERGLIGPRERERLWDRHVLNSVGVADVVPRGADVLDVGSGAGLPGVPLALARPDLSVTLLDPLLRRAIFLEEVAGVLGIADRVTVMRARAEDVAGRVSADVVTSRALAPLARLVDWCLPLTRPDGVVAALKGASAQDEAARDAEAVRASGGDSPRVVTCGSEQAGTLAHVVLVHHRATGGGGVAGA